MFCPSPGAYFILILFRLNHSTTVALKKSKKNVVLSFVGRPIGKLFGKKIFYK